MIRYHSAFEQWPLNDREVQSIITSPPYYRLRKYNIPDVVIGGSASCHHLFDSNGRCQCGAWKGQYGWEESPSDYINHTMLWINEAWRVLRDDGIMFIVIDDKYNSKKSLSLIPEKIMIQMSEMGWIIRNRITWIRTLPESVKDRFSSVAETIIFATKKPSYYFNLDVIKKPLKEVTLKRYMKGFPLRREKNYTEGAFPYENQRKLSEKVRNSNSITTKNPGNVWLDEWVEEQKEAIKTAGVDAYFETIKEIILSESDIFPPLLQNNHELHYAPFSEKLVRRLILCSTRPSDIVLDPFVGTGTTVKVAMELGRKGIGFDIGYSEIHERRLRGVNMGLTV